jgi:hypothetical protein
MQAILHALEAQHRLTCKFCNPELAEREGPCPAHGGRNAQRSAKVVQLTPRRRRSRWLRWLG